MDDEREVAEPHEEVLAPASDLVERTADRLVEALAVAIDQRDAWNIEGELINLLSRQVAYFPYFINAGSSGAKPGVTGIQPVNAACQSGDCEITWNVAEWDISR